MNKRKDSGSQFDDNQLMVNSASVHADYLLQTALKYAE